MNKASHAAAVITCLRALRFVNTIRQSQQQQQALNIASGALSAIAESEHGIDHGDQYAPSGFMTEGKETIRNRLDEARTYGTFAITHRVGQAAGVETLPVVLYAVTVSRE